MRNSDLLVQILGIILGAGLLRFLIDIVQVRRQGKREKPEVDGIVVKGAESAVLSMGKALEAADRRITVLEAQVKEKDARIEHLEQLVDQLRLELTPLLRAAQEANDTESS